MNSLQMKNKVLLSHRFFARALLLTLASVFLTACATGPKTPIVDFKQDFNFNDVTKVAFYHESGMVSGDNPVQLSDMQRERLDEAVSAALSGRGFQVVGDASEADLLVSWHLVTQHQTDVHQSSSFGFGYGRGYRYGHVGYRYGGYYDPFSCAYGPGYGSLHPTVFVQNYTRGKFIVDMIDPVTDKSVWRAITESRLRDDPTIEQEKYTETANFLFSTFPPHRQAQ